VIGRAVAASVFVVTLLAGCAGPSFSHRDYERKAAHTAEEANAVVQTALLTVQAAGKRRAPRQFLDVLLTDAESTLADIQASFEGVQPPEPDADQLRSDLGDLLSRAGDVLSTLRIEVRRGRLGALPETAGPLTGLHDKLEAFAEEHR